MVKNYTFVNNVQMNLLEIIRGKISMCYKVRCVFDEGRYEACVSSLVAQIVKCLPAMQETQV